MVNQAPGCFGIPSIFSFRSSVCEDCEYFAACRYDVEKELRNAPDSPAMRRALLEHDRHTLITGASVGAVKTLSKRPSRAIHANFALTIQQRDLVSSLPAGVGKELKAIYRRGLDVVIRNALLSQSDVILMSYNNRAMKLAVSMLREGFTRKEFKSAIVEKFGWSTSSAWSKTSLIWALLQALDLAVEIGDSLKVNPNLFDHNNRLQH